MSSKLPPYFLVSESVRQSAIRLLLSLPIDADKPFVMQIKAKTRRLDQSEKLHDMFGELAIEPICFADEHGYYVLLTDAQSIIDALTDELERERMRLAACGVVALADAVESAKQAREIHNDYKSASCGDVARRVDEFIALRTERDALRKQMEQGDDKPAIPEDMTLVPKAEFAALETELRRASRKGNLNCDIDPMWDALSEAMLATADKCHD